MLKNIVSLVISCVLNLLCCVCSVSVSISLLMIIISSILMMRLIL